MDISKQSIPRLAGYLVFLLLMGGALYFLWSRQQPGQPVISLYTSTHTPNSALEKNDASYRQAQAAARLGKYAEAEKLYADALTRASDQVQKSQIRYKIISMKDLGGTTLDTIPQYKALIADTTVTALIRAYAAYRIGRMYMLEPTDAAFSAIFSDEPYQSMVIDGDREASMKNFYEFAAAIYPLALPTLFSASWYADQLVSAKAGIVILSPDQKDSYLKKINDGLRKAQTDIDRIIKDQNENSLVAPATAQMAYIDSQLFFVGVVQEQEAHAAYDKALQYATVYNQPGEDGFTRLRYAVFLTKIDAKKNADKITQMLVPFYTDVLAKARVQKYLKLLPGVKTTSHEYRSIVLLAKSNVAFKNQLLQLGWNADELR